MPDFTFRELVFAAAIVLILTSLFVDRQVLNVLRESLGAFW